MSTTTHDNLEAETWAGETDAVNDARPVRQGDVLRWEKQTPPWEIFGIIVTADCDIAQGKHGGTLSYVPVLSLHDYWRLFTIPKKIEKYLTDKFHQQARERIRALHKKHKPEYIEQLSDQAIIDLVRDFEPNAVMDTLGVPAEERIGPLRMIRALRTALQPFEGQSLDRLAGILAELRAANTPNNANLDSVLDELPTEVGKLPGDAFFIGRLTPNDADGFVAYLRSVRSLDATALAILPKDLKRPEARARRIARLRSPFIYRLTQQLGQVFSDIGLPTDYESRRAILAKTARSSIKATPKPPGAL